MRIIDADSLMDDIKRDSKKAIDEGDKVGSFWLGYAAGLVIKQPTIQPEKAQLSQEGTTKDATSDLISRTETVKQLQGVFDVTVPITDYDGGFIDGVEVGVSTVSTMPPAQPEPQWIPVNERLPEDLSEVNVTWVNHNPELYYESTKDKPFTATAVYYNGEWYWYSATCVDYLEEYGRCDWNKIDEAIEIIAWMPLPSPYTK